jgi:hypothetical protein
VYQGAREREMMLLVFCEKPDTVKDEATGQAWLDGYLAGCHVPRTEWVAVYLVPKGIGVEKAMRGFIEHHQDVIDNPLTDLGVTVLKGANFLDKKGG